MDFRRIAERVNRLLYRREVARLTPAEKAMADAWTLRLIRERHPGWTQQQIRDYFENLIHLKVRVVKEWELRMGIEVPFDDDPSPPPEKSTKPSKKSHDAA